MIASLQGAAAPLVADLRTVFGDRLRSVVAYGPHLEGQTDAPLACLALVRRLAIEDLEACAKLSTRWARARFATPLILGEEEFRKSLDAFPLEYGEIVRAHVDVYGDDPFASIVIAREDLRRACETQVKSHLVHLRESFIETRGTPRAVADLVRTAAPAFAALLRNVARLGDGASQNRAEATRQGARLAGIDERLVATILSFETSPAGDAADPARLFPEYLAAVEQLANAVDTWRG